MTISPVAHVATSQPQHRARPITRPDVWLFAQALAVLFVAGTAVALLVIATSRLTFGGLPFWYTELHVAAASALLATAWVMADHGLRWARRPDPDALIMVIPLLIVIPTAVLFFLRGFHLTLGGFLNILF